MADFSSDFASDFNIEQTVSYDDCDRETVVAARGPEFSFHPSGG